MMAGIHKAELMGGGVVLAAASFFASYAGLPLVFFVPGVLAAVLILLRRPTWLLYALVGTLPWSFEYQVSETLATDLPDEPLMLLGAFAALALLLTKARTKFRGFSPILFLLLLSYAWMLISVAASSAPLYSLKYAAAKAWYLLAFVALPLLVGTEEKLVTRLAVVLFVSMFTAALVAICRHAVLGFTFADVNNALAPFFRNHVNYAALLVLVVPLQIAFLRSAKPNGLRRLLWCSLLIVAAALYLSYSRGAWLALLAGAAAFWLIRKGWLFRFFLLAATAVVLGAGWLGYKSNFLRFAPEHDATIFHTDFRQHLMATYHGRDVSTAERFYRWTAAPQMIADRPLTGFGPATFYVNYKPYTVPLFRTWVSDNKEKSTVHNYFLLLAIEQGLPGLLLFLAMLGVMFWQAQRIYSCAADRFWQTVAAACGAVLLMQCTVNFLSDLIETDKVGSVFYLTAAVLVMADRVTRMSGTNDTN